MVTHFLPLGGDAFVITIKLLQSDFQVFIFNFFIEKLYYFLDFQRLLDDTELRALL